MPDEPTATEGEDKAAAAAVIEFEKKVAAEKDPLVRDILQVKPTTPEQWIYDIQALLNLNRAEFAKAYLEQFLAVKPDTAELAQLQSRFGSAFFLRLSNSEALQPEGAAVASAVLKAASDRINNAQRLTTLVDRLHEPDMAARRQALVELVKAGSASVPPLVAVLKDADRAVEHAAVRTALVALGREAVSPLIAALQAPDRALRLQIIDVLGRIDSREAIPDLLSAALPASTDTATADPVTHDPEVEEAARKLMRDVLGQVPSRDEAIRFLTRSLDSYLAGTAPGLVNENNQVTVWSWDESQQQLVQESLPRDDASFRAAARVARQLYAIDPGNEDHHKIYLATALEAAKRQNGYDRPLSEQSAAIYQPASASGTELLEGVLALALEKKLQGAAMAAIDLLGQTKDVGLLKSVNGKPRLLAQALKSSFRRVQFAAARAIMSIDPTQSYSGSSYLREALGYLSASGGRRRVLIGDPRTDVAQQLAGFFNTLGFEADTRQAGRELVLQAFDSPDYSMVLIGDAIDRPRYRDVVQTLRRDPRTADLPVGIMVREINAQSARRFAETDPLTLAFAPPRTQEDIGVDARRLLEAAGRAYVSEDERIREATYALDALIQLAEQPDRYGFYNLLQLDERMERALTNPVVAAKAARVLGLLGTPRAQRALLEFASTQLQPLVDRKAAVEALRVAVQQRGLLLTRDRLLHQYDLYNDSEILDPDTQQVLASLLDVIEAPTRSTDPSKNND